MSEHNTPGQHRHTTRPEHVKRPRRARRGNRERLAAASSKSKQKKKFSCATLRGQKRSTGSNHKKRPFCFCVLEVSKERLEEAIETVRHGKRSRTKLATLARPRTSSPPTEVAEVLAEEHFASLDSSSANFGRPGLRSEP